MTTSTSPTPELDGLTVYGGQVATPSPLAPPQALFTSRGQRQRHHRAAKCSGADTIYGGDGEDNIQAGAGANLSMATAATTAWLAVEKTPLWWQGNDTIKLVMEPTDRRGR